MKIVRILAGLYEENCYIICDEKTLETAIIDPGGHYKDIISYIESIGGIPKFILLTHGHMDHTGACDRLSSHFDIPVYLNHKDQEITDRNEYLFDRIHVDKDLLDNDSIKLGELDIKVITTPGHTPGGVSFLCANFVFTGDSLFQLSIGRTDLPFGDTETLIESIKEKLFVLPPATMVYPGHGERTTIGIEVEQNPFIV